MTSNGRVRALIRAGIRDVSENPGQKIFCTFGQKSLCSCRKCWRSIKMPKKNNQAFLVHWLVAQADLCVYFAAARRQLGWTLACCRSGLLGWGGWELELEALQIGSMCHTTFLKDFSGCRVKNAELAAMHLLYFQFGHSRDYNVSQTSKKLKHKM